MKRYLAYFGSNHFDFRLPELEAVAKLNNINLTYDKTINPFDTPFVEVFVDSEEDILKIANRTVTIKAFYEIYGSGTNYDEVINGVKKYIAELPDEYAKYSRADRSFKFLVDGHNRKLSFEEKMARITAFKFMDLKSVVNLDNPTDIFAIFEDYRRNDKTTPVRIFMCRQVVLGRRDLIELFSLKKRQYLGITSMDSELSLIGANMALARDGMLIVDPFVGTGSLVITCAHFGAMTMGGDIDASAITGKEDGKNLFTNFGQYNVLDKLVDVMKFDHHKNDLIRTQEWFDAIVCDPPYGIRAGAKKVGVKKRSLNWIPKTDPSSHRSNQSGQRHTLQELVDMDNAETKEENDNNNNNADENKEEQQNTNNNTEENKDSETKHDEKAPEHQGDNEDDDKDSDSDKEDTHESDKKDEKESSMSESTENVPDEHKNNPYYGNKNRHEYREQRRKAKNQRMREKMKEKKQKKYYENKALMAKGEHIPQCVPYSVVELLSDLLGFAARTLTVGGRLVYWLPTTTEYKDSDVPQHPCFRIAANSSQPLSTKFARRLITMEKVIPYDEALHGNLPPIEYSIEEQPAHANLAMKILKDVNRHDKRNELDHVKPKYEELFGDE